MTYYPNRPLGSSPEDPAGGQNGNQNSRYSYQGQNNGSAESPAEHDATAGGQNSGAPQPPTYPNHAAPRPAAIPASATMAMPVAPSPGQVPGGNGYPPRPSQPAPGYPQQAPPPGYPYPGQQGPVPTKKRSSAWIWALGGAGLLVLVAVIWVVVAAFSSGGSETAAKAKPEAGSSAPTSVTPPTTPTTPTTPEPTGGEQGQIVQLQDWNVEVLETDLDVGQRFPDALTLTNMRSGQKLIGIQLRFENVSSKSREPHAELAFWLQDVTGTSAYLEDPWIDVPETVLAVGYVAPGGEADGWIFFVVEDDYQSGALNIVPLTDDDLESIEVPIP